MHIRSPHSYLAHPFKKNKKQDENWKIDINLDVILNQMIAPIKKILC